MKRITPLNIAAGLFLTWTVLRLVTDDSGSLGIGWFLLFLLLIAVADQFFRLLLSELKRIWIAETVFIALVAAVIWVLKR